MSKLNAFERARQLADENAKTVHNMHEETEGGGGGRVLLPAGEYYGYLCQYIDLGDHEDEFNGKVTGVFPFFRAAVALFYYPSEIDDSIEPSDDEEQKYTVVPVFDTAIKTSSRANAVKMFKGLNVSNDPDITSIPQFLGAPRRFKVTVSKNGRYNNIDFAATGPAREGRPPRDIELPDIDEKDVQVFFWNNPTLEDWNKLEIEERVLDDGRKVENFIQNKILSAKNFAGSPLDILLQGEGVEINIPPFKWTEVPDDVEAEALAQPEAEIEDIPAEVTDAAPKAPRAPRVPRRPGAAK